MFNLVDIYVAEYEETQATASKKASKAKAAAAANTKPCTESAPVTPTRHEIPVGILEGEEALISMSYKDLKWAKRWADNWEWEEVLKPMLQFTLRASRRMRADFLWQEQGFDAYNQVREELDEGVERQLAPIVAKYRTDMKNSSQEVELQGGGFYYVAKASGYYTLKDQFCKQIQKLANGLRAMKAQVPKAKSLHKIIDGVANHLENCANYIWRKQVETKEFFAQRGTISSKKQLRLLEEAKAYGLIETYAMGRNSDSYQVRQAAFALLEKDVKEARNRYCRRASDEKTSFSMAEALKKAGLC